MKDKEILEKLRQHEHRLAFRALYKHYPKILKYILGNNGSEEDAKDIFQESLIIFYQKVIKNEYEHTAQISTYLYAIARNKWLKIIRDKKEHNFSSINSEQDLDLTKSQEDYHNLDESTSKEESLELFIHQKIKELGEPCQSILVFHEFYKYSMGDIAQKMGYKNEATVRQQKYKCINRLKKLIPRQVKETYLNTNKQ